MRIVGLKVQGTGTNEIFNTSCCTYYPNFEIWLNNGEQPKQIDRLIYFDPTIPVSSFINEVDSSPYADPLVNPFYLDVGFGCEVELDFCETVGVGGIFATQLDVYWSNFAGSGINTFFFEFVVIDIDDYKIVQKDNVNFYDCANDCGKIQTITGLDNPSDAPLDITFNDPLNGYSYYV
ncbi:MAG: hypothetical protein ACKOPP_06045, partial [Bacteroidota bacterium]